MRTYMHTISILYVKSFNDAVNSSDTISLKDERVTNNDLEKHGRKPL
jgi:hypothetical protein